MKMAANRAVLCLLAAIVAAGCAAGRRSVPVNGVAVVGDTLVTKRQYERLCVRQGCAVPTSTEQAAFRAQVVTVLVERAQLEQKAAELGIEVSREECDRRLEGLIQQYFAGSHRRYDEQLRQQGLNEAQVVADICAQVLQEKVHAEVTKGVEVSDKEIETAYSKNKRQYVKPATREVRHILVKRKELADSLYSQLQGGADFATLVKKYSQDPPSKGQGGKLTISRGQTVPPFDKSAFSLATRTISKPIKTGYGWHIIQPLTRVARSKTAPFSRVRDAIRQQLIQVKKQEKMAAWTNELRKDFAGRTYFQIGFVPPPTVPAPRLGR